ncbi:MAG: SUMF1/EgtB/PvdO family nonheme iron enzyme [Nitrospira sp.]
MATIYLSSTYEDLKDHRRVVYEALRKAGHQVVAMEDYVATDQRPIEKCLKDVEKADIYVGLFAFRYGYRPPSEHSNPHGLSITELEYRCAESSKKPCLTFIVHDTTPWSRIFDDALTGDDRGERIKALRQHLLTEKLASQFSSPHELSTLVLAAVTKYLDAHKQLESEKNQASVEAATSWDIEKDGSPYPGLMHFTRKYAPVYFGRDLEIGEILDRVREPEGRFLLIGGASGSGKSSLVDAGVLPRIEQHGIGGKTYTCVRMLPSEGSHPCDALLRPLHAHAERAGIKPYQVAEHLSIHPEDLSQHLQDIVTKGLNTDGLMLFVDQMEELFTVRDQTHAHAFLSALSQAAQEAHIHVIATIRSDFLPHCHEHPDLLKVLNGRGYYALAAPDGRSLHDMIAKPAHCAGLTISDRLVRRLVAEVEQERGSFPLLAFALQQLFDKREGDELTEAAFDHMGGLTGAIRTHVASVENKIGKVTGADDGQVYAKLFASLVVVTMDRTPTRKRALKKGFDATMQSVIELLTNERLLIAEGTEQQSLVAVAHEKLFEGWPKLAGWIEANREQLFVLWRAESEAGEWERHGYDLNYLWPAERLKKLREILDGPGHEAVHHPVRRYAAPQHTLIECLQDASLSHTDRLKIGQYLAALGDPRPGVGLCSDGVPDIVWVEIPGGKIKLEEVDHVFQVKPFKIAKYPVTNAQFQAFLEAADGYQNDEWWEGIQHQEVAQSSWSEANSPRETVSWYEAVAFCRWLSIKVSGQGGTSVSIRLPTEWEWQQAATGGDSQREYPWKGGWNAARCNSEESRLRQTTAVGMYPQGATQQGVLDMAGNVWEWCLNEYASPEQPKAVRIDKEGDFRAFRGGSWYNGPVNLRASNRGSYGAGYRYNGIGFRLAQDLES